jgi:ATP-dependent DNA ligase
LVGQFERRPLRWRKIVSLAPENSELSCTHNLLAGFIAPSLHKVRHPSTGALWLHEIKHDGFRGQQPIAPDWLKMKNPACSKR